MTKVKVGTEKTNDRTNQLLEKKITELGNTLNKNIRNLMKHNHESHGDKEERYSKSKSCGKHQVSPGSKTRKWLKTSRSLNKDLTNQLLFGNTFKLPIVRKIAGHLYNLDQKVSGFLENVANAEFVVTRDNIVSKTARRILGIRLPHETSYAKILEGLLKRKPTALHEEADSERIDKNHN